jgi:hypothetical protein
MMGLVLQGCYGLNEHFGADVLELVEQTPTRVVLEADGHELYAILMNIRNFPVTIEETQWWYNDHARTIMRNWDKYWSKTTVKDLKNFLEEESHWMLDESKQPERG